MYSTSYCSYTIEINLVLNPLHAKFVKADSKRSDKIHSRTLVIVRHKYSAQLIIT